MLRFHQDEDRTSFHVGIANQGGCGWYASKRRKSCRSELFTSANLRNALCGFQSQKSHGVCERIARPAYKIPRESHTEGDAMIDKPLYKPVAKDLDWAKQMMDGLRDGGVLKFPSAQLIYHVDHEHKALTLQNLDQTVESFDSFVVHEQTKIVFAQIGYTVKDKE